MAWIWLLLAGICEVFWAIGLKKTEGLTRFLTDPSKVWVTTWTVALMILSFVLLAQAMRTLPLGTAYAIWTGIGAVGTVVYGMVVLGEPRDAVRLLCLTMIVAGIVGLKLFGTK